MDTTHEISNRQYSRTFTARSPFISVIYPAGSDSFEQPYTITILWNDGYFNKRYFPNVKIELYKNNTYNSTIAESVENTGSYSAELTGKSDGLYKIKISVAGYEEVYGYSDLFTLTGGYINPWILTNYYYGENIPYEIQGWFLTNYKYEENTNSDIYPNGWMLLTDGED